MKAVIGPNGYSNTTTQTQSLTYNVVHLMQGQCDDMVYRGHTGDRPVSNDPFRSERTVTNPQNVDIV